MGGVRRTLPAQVGTTRTYRQAIEEFCRFADGRLRKQASAASMARPDPDLAALLMAWEGQLPSRFPLGSTRPAPPRSAR